MAGIEYVQILIGDLDINALEQMVAKGTSINGTGRLYFQGDPHPIEVDVKFHTSLFARLKREAKDMEVDDGER